MAPAELAILTGQSSPRVRQRSQSISSDRPSLQGYGGLLSPPVIVSPDPAFIAASAASQIVTNDHDSQADTWLDQHGIEPSGETALVSQQSLNLVNRFLDQLLFNFLSHSRSTSLAALRPAVSEVLKPKLAAGAINGADQELNEYLGGGEDEELLALHSNLEASRDWDLELVWKRTRLRCMVYSSLGDMEEEDEDYYTKQEHLDGPPGTSNRYSSNPGIVSPAVAIFLTSILEFMGEQVLIVAGQAAYHRLRAKLEKEERDGLSTPSEIAERVVVEDHDMERVALDRTLGRLWRGWKKRVRSPDTSISISRSFSRESLHSQPTGSKAPGPVPQAVIDEDERRPSLAAVLAEAELASNIPLPMTENDIDEIEVPGLANYSDDEDEEESSGDDEGYHIPTRPKSMVSSYGTPAVSEGAMLRPSISRNRSNSMPVPAPSPYISPKKSKTSLEESSSAGDVPAASSEVTSAETELVKVDSLVDSVTTKEITKEEAVPEEQELVEQKSLVTSSLVGVAGVAAMGAAAAAAAGALAAPHTKVMAMPSSEDLKNEVDLDEEPQIMTSSRVSLGGRVSPDDLKNLSRKSSVRSPSVHSLRLIDVAPPKSPQRSRHGSVDASERISMAHSSTSRSSSIYSTVIDTQVPRIGSPTLRGAGSSPVVRNGSSLSISRARNSAGESIAEVEEKGMGMGKTDEMNGSELESEPTTAVPADLAATMQNATNIEKAQSQAHATNYADKGYTSQTFHSPPQPSTFVLGAAPASRNARSPLESSSSSLPMQSNHTSNGTKAIGLDNGVPPLTPLREMMEGAPDTSDDSSSITQSNASFTESSLYRQSSSTAQSQRAPDQQRSAWGSAVTRGSPPRGSRPDTARTVTADSPARSHRHLRTSGSGSSGTSGKIRATRTSEEGESKSQSFEQLIRSDQTIQYTLTPQNMRDIESIDSPRNALTPNVSIGQEFRPSTSRSHSSSITKFAGLHSNPLLSHPPTSAAASIKSNYKPIPRSTPASINGSRVRSNAPQARDARIDRDSMGDFAEFIRSTGPVTSYEQAPSIMSSNHSRSGSHRGANGSTRNASGSVPRVGLSANVPRRADSSSGRNRLQARDAVVSRGDSISDLIDFVRSGPQLDKDTHRIPRTVAPFRSTMDSDQMSGAVGGKAIDASLPDPRYSQASNSVDSSVTSQAPLLRNKPLPVHKTNEFDEEDMMPKRKTRRVRDPYAIDFSDDEEEFEALTASRPKPIQEESLADFLRNVPPPPEPVVTTSVFADVPRPPSKGLKKKSSSPSIMSRFGRNNSVSSQPSSNPKSRSGPEAARSVSASKPYPSHTPIAAQYSTASNASVFSVNTSASSSPQLNNSSRTKVAQKSYQPREAVYTQSRQTSDLADFFMRNEPPPSMQPQPQAFIPTVHKEEATAFQRMFGRKKVH